MLQPQQAGITENGNQDVRFDPFFQLMEERVEASPLLRIRNAASTSVSG
jgi:hypothetical protein